jgi:hypothetical protein
VRAKTDGADVVEATIAHARQDVDLQAAHSSDALSRDVLEDCTVAITDARPGASRLSLDEDGFVLRKEQTAVADFFDLDQINDVYLPEALGLVIALSGARDGVVLEHVIRGPVRMAADHPEYGRHMLGWALKAHIDGDEATYRTWAAHVAEPALAARCEVEPFAVYNVWRPITPVEQRPLALCHARSVQRDDLVPAFYDGRFPGMPASEYYPAIAYFHLAHNPEHRWYYFPDMQPDEILVFKQWDSDESNARCVPHSAFVDPTSRPDPVPRTSIEVRVFALR